MVHDLPTRADLTKLEKLAKRLLNHHKQQEVRMLAKGLLWVINELDRYAESLYPCFLILENKLKQENCTLNLGADGIFRLRDKEKRDILSGETLKDLFINALLWDGAWVSEEDFSGNCQQEDKVAGLETDTEIDSDAINP